MTHLMHSSPTVGSVIKKVIEVNPELSAQDLIQIIRESIQPQGPSTGEFASVEVVNVEKALQLARMKGRT